MNPQQIQVKDNILKRILLLYGLYSLLSNAFFIIGYYFLPEGFLRGSPQMVPGEFVAQQTGFWAQFGMTLFFNLGVMTVIILLMNVNQVNGFPVGYLLPISLGIIKLSCPGDKLFCLK